MRIAIVIPSGDMVHTDFAMSLTNLVAHSIKSCEVTIINPRSSMIPKGRWDGVKQALSIGADYILFIDSDQTFPPHALMHLLQRNRPIIGATCLTRREPIEYTARDAEGSRIDFSNLTGVHPVTSNGFPFCLINAKVFQRIPEPWFAIGYNPNTGKWVSEDEYFCHQVAAKGYTVYVDADLTKQIGHLGVYEYI